MNPGSNTHGQVVDAYGFEAAAGARFRVEQLTDLYGNMNETEYLAEGSEESEVILVVLRHKNSKKASLKIEPGGLFIFGHESVVQDSPFLFMTNEVFIDVYRYGTDDVELIITNLIGHFSGAHVKITPQHLKTGASIDPVYQVQIMNDETRLCRVREIDGSYERYIVSTL